MAIGWDGPALLVLMRSLLHGL